jgi:hypothetical protein
MEEAPENGKELSHCARGSGVNGCYVNGDKKGTEIIAGNRGKDIK